MLCAFSADMLVFVDETGFVSFCNFKVFVKKVTYFKIWKPYRTDELLVTMDTALTEPALRFHVPQIGGKGGLLLPLLV